MFDRTPFVSTALVRMQSELDLTNMMGPAGISEGTSSVWGHEVVVERVGLAVGEVVGASVARISSLAPLVGARVGDAVVYAVICKSSTTIS